MTKACADGQERNAKTKRCMKKCKTGTTRNPATNRCKAVKKKAIVKDDVSDKKTSRTVVSDKKQSVKKTSRTVVSDKKQDASFIPSFCGVNEAHIEAFADAINLPETKRVTLQKEPCKTLQSFFPKKCIPKEWRITNVLGAGSFGFVFSTRGPGNERGALKVMKEDRDVDVEHETRIGIKFHGLGLGPEIKSHCTFKPKGGVTIHLIHMSRIDTTVEKYLAVDRTDAQIENVVDKLFKAISTMEENGITHGDFHFGNIGFKNNNTLQIIDFGFSTDKVSMPILDIYQLIRVNLFYNVGKKPVTRGNKKIFDTLARKYAKNIYNIVRIPKSDRKLTEMTFNFREEMQKKAEK